jgi:chromosome segregation ATPase
MTPSEREKLVIQRMSYQSNLRNLKFDYDEKLKEIKNNFESKIGELGIVDDKNSRLKNENERLVLLNNNLLQSSNDFEAMIKRQQESSESIKNNNTKKIKELQDLIYGFEKSKKSLEYSIGDLVAKKEKEINKLKEYQKQEKDYSVFVINTKIDKKRLEKLKSSIEAEQAKLNLAKESLKSDIKEFEISKKENDKKFTKWTKLETRVQQYARLLQNYYNEHNIRLSILNKFGL